MPNIKEIALNIADKSGAVAYSPAPLRAVRGYSFTFEQLQNFAEALVAEIQRQSEPVGYKMTLEESLRTDGRTPVLWFGQLPHGSLLFTFPPTASQIEQETAEAWVSVNERLPELRDEVLVYCGYFTLGYRSDDIHDPECHQGWVIDFDNGNAHGITHWQPLPTPPKRSMEGV